MRTYQCIKQVFAEKIVDVGSVFHSEDHDYLNIQLEDGEIHTVPVEVVTRYLPVAGDYLVQSDNGYFFILQKEEFESGYAEAVSETAKK